MKTKKRYPSRPVYGSESANRPSALGYGSGTSGGYSYGVSGHGGYGGRPSGYGGSNGGYGISGTLADGDEFGPGDSAYPDGSLPQHPGNLHAQKVRYISRKIGIFRDFITYIEESKTRRRKILTSCQ